MVVTSAPHPTPEAGEATIRVRMPRSAAPAMALRPSVSSTMPSRKMPSPPMRATIMGDGTWGLASVREGCVGRRTMAARGGVAARAVVWWRARGVPGVGSRGESSAAGVPWRVTEQGSMAFPRKNIRNFSIIAHRPRQEHACRSSAASDQRGMSREAKDQILDSMDIERERGITIKRRRSP